MKDIGEHGPERLKKKLPKASDIVLGKIPDGQPSISPSGKGEGNGPTYEYRFSPDSEGPHKVEVFSPDLV